MATSPPKPRPGSPTHRARHIAEDLFRDHRRFLLAVAERNSADRGDAEDALQETFITFLDRFDATGDTPPLAWFTLTLKRRCWAIYRRRRGAPDQPLIHLLDTVGDTALSPHETAELTEQMKRNRSLLKMLKPNERRVLGLIAAGFSYEEIMTITGWSYTKVNRSARDGRARLRRWS